MPSHYQGSLRDRKVLSTYIKLIRAVDSLIGHVSRTFYDNRLTISQFGVLDALYHLGPMCQSILAQKILKSSGNMTMVIDNLEKQKLVSRIRDKDDRRKMTVLLTKTGKDLFEELLPGHVALIAEAFTEFSVEEMDILGNMAKKLGWTLHPPVVRESLANM
ncbi:MAG: MarR family transcriptional regulator [bacterium]